MFIWRALNKMKISRVNEYHSIPQLVYLSFSRYIKKIKRLEFWLLSFLLFDVLVKLCLRIDADVLLSCQFQIDEGSKNSPSFIEKNDDADRVKLLDGNLNVSKVFERKFGYLIQGEEWNFRIWCIF